MPKQTEERIKNIFNERRKLKKIYLILLVASSVLLFATGIFTLIFSGSVFSKLKETDESSVLTEMNIVLLSSAWLFMSYFVAMSAYHMNKKVTRNWIYLTLSLGIIVIFLGNFLSGPLIVVVSIILLVRDTRLMRKIH